MSTGRQTEQGRAERKDLEVGAVDELLVGECEVERVRQGTKKHYVACSLWLFSLPSLLLTNNIILFYFLLFILSIIS